jgi:hypothetical protein
MEIKGEWIGRLRWYHTKAQLDAVTALTGPGFTLSRASAAIGAVSPHSAAMMPPSKPSSLQWSHLRPGGSWT